MRSRQISLVIASVVVALLALVLVGATLTVWAGNPDSPAGPTDPAAQMYTLEQIYDRLDTGAAATKMTTFTEPSSGPGTGTMHTLNEIYDLVGERAPVPKTGQTTSYRPGDDGDLEKGVSWPSPRFTGDGTGVITDHLTGLMWAENANLDGTKTWNDAIDYCNGLSLGGYTDWRLPNVRELFSLIHLGQANSATWLNGQGFSGVQSDYYWASTTFADHTAYAWGVDLTFGSVSYDDKTYYNYVWPVRGGQ